MIKSVGIDDIAAYSPRLYVDGSEFEIARKKIPGHMTVGIGIEKMSIPDAHEDANTMGAMSVIKLLKQNNLTPKDIGRFEVATETSYDESKAANAYIIGMIEKVYGKNSCEHCGGVERKFACASAGYAVYDLVNWIRADENDGKPGIVVATDIARYDIEKPEERDKGLGSECTQGGGSVSMLIGENPRLLNIEPKATAWAIVDERDFYRPFGKKSAIVDPERSNLCYLLTSQKAYVNWKEGVLKSGVIKMAADETVLDYVDRMVFHMPYPRMAEYNYAFLLRHEWRNLPRWKEITDVIGEEPIHEEGTIESILKDKKFTEKDTEFRRKFVKTPQFIKSYKEKVESSRKLSEQVANIYTGSSPLGTLSLFEIEHKMGKDLSGKRIGQGYYASGATALVTSGIISENYKEAAKKFNMLEELEKRRKISIEDYEALHEGLRKQSIIQPHKEFVFIGETNGYRNYDFVD